MAGPTLLVASPATPEHTRAVIECLLSRVAAVRDADNLWLTQAFRVPLAHHAPIVCVVSDGADDIGMPECMSLVEIGAMANRPSDHAAIVSLAIDLGQALSGHLLLKTTSAPPAHPGVVTSLATNTHTNTAAFTTHTVLLSADAATAWWASGSLHLVK